MSLQSEAAQPAPKPTPFLENIIRFLMPYFLPVTTTQAEARSEILETLASYGALTRSAMLSAAQAIAFGFASLDTLKEAKDPDLSPSMRLRYRGCANNLTRSAEKAEHFLINKRLCEPAAAQKPPAEPVNDTTDEDAQAAIARANAQIAQQRQKAEQQKPQQPRTQPLRQSPLQSSDEITPEEQKKRDHLWGLALIEALAELGMPVEPMPVAASHA